MVGGLGAVKSFKRFQGFREQEGSKPLGIMELLGRETEEEPFEMLEISRKSSGFTWG